LALGQRAVTAHSAACAAAEAASTIADHWRPSLQGGMAAALRKLGAVSAQPAKLPAPAGGAARAGAAAAAPSGGAGGPAPAAPSAAPPAGVRAPRRPPPERGAQPELNDFVRARVPRGEVRALLPPPSMCPAFFARVRWGTEGHRCTSATVQTRLGSGGWKAEPQPPTPPTAVLPECMAAEQCARALGCLLLRLPLAALTQRLAEAHTRPKSACRSPFVWLQGGTARNA